MRKTTTLLSSSIILMLTASCVTYKTPTLENNYKFSKEDKKGLLAYSSNYVTHNAVVVITPLDLENKKLGKSITLGSGLGATYSVGNRDNPEFRLAKVPPGIYGWTSLYRSGYSSFNYYNYCRGTIAFEVEAGKVNMVIAKRQNVPDPAALDRLSNLLKPYPKVTAEIKAARVPFAIKFDQASNGGEVCQKIRTNNVPYITFPWASFVDNSKHGETLD